jgi:hypothetical protein
MAQAVAAAGLEQTLLRSFRPLPDFKRVAQEGAALRELKKNGVISAKPQRRVDYRDFYVVHKPLSILGHQAVLFEEEYQIRFIGCCVNDGAGVVLRLQGDTRALEDFAKKNQCKVRKYGAAGELRGDGFGLEELPLADGQYAHLSCHVNDEQE